MHVSYFFLNCLQACGDIDGHFTSKIMEPHLIIFEDEDSISPMFIAGKDDSLLELPVHTIGEGIAYFMDMYYVFNVKYSRAYQPLLFFSRSYHGQSRYM